MKQYIGDGMLLITAIVWGSGFVVTAIALEYLTAYQVMAGRFILAAMILSLLFGKKFKTFYEVGYLEGSHFRNYFVYWVRSTNSWFGIHHTLQKCLSNRSKCCDCTINCLSSI